MKNWQPRQRICSRTIRFYSATAISCSLVFGAIGIQIVEPMVSNQEPLTGIQEKQSGEFAKEISLTIVDYEGKPLSGVEVEINYWIEDRQMKELITLDDDAEFEFQVPKNASNVFLIAKKSGYISYCIQRDSNNSPMNLPRNELVQLIEGGLLGGQVINEDGTPVSNARVLLSMPAQDSTMKGYAFEFQLGEVVTNQEGHWTFEEAPVDLYPYNITAQVTHPDYLESYGVANGRAIDTRMVKGSDFSGFVVDANGRPINAAKVCLGSPVATNSILGETDMAGQFILRNCRKGETVLVVWADGFAPQVINVSVEKEQQHDDMPQVELEPGKSVIGKVVDSNGDPIPGVSVYNRVRSILLPAELRARTDENGEFEYEQVGKQDGGFNIVKPGYLSKSNVSLKREVDDVEDQVITLNEQLNVVGKVVDSDTGKVIPEVFVGSGWKSKNIPSETNWDGQYRTYSGDKIDFKFIFERAKFVLRFSAIGYQSVVKEFDPTNGKTVVEIELKKFASQRDAIWEPVRIQIESGQLKMSQVEAAQRLHELGATIGLDKKVPIGLLLWKTSMAFLERCTAYQNLKKTSRKRLGWAVTETSLFFQSCP